MPWGRIDDQFHDHPKVLALANREDPLNVWVRALSWCLRHSRDGFLPERVAKAFGTEDAIHDLIEEELWDPAPGGYKFHDFEVYGPPGAAKEGRSATAERAARYREKRKTAPPSVTEGVTERDDRHAQTVTGRDGGRDEPPEKRDGVTVESVTERDEKRDERDDRHATSPRAGAISRPVPSRPVPERDARARPPARTRTRERPPGIPPSPAEVLKELENGRDLWPLEEVPEQELEAVAASIANAVLNEPTCVRDGVTPLVAAREGVAYARARLARYPDKGPRGLLADCESCGVRYLPDACRKGERRAKTNGSALAVSDDGTGLSPATRVGPDRRW